MRRRLAEENAELVRREASLQQQLTSANDELAGALRVGMRALLIHRPGDPPLWPEVQAWDGPRVTSIPEVLEVLDAC